MDISLLTSILASSTERHRRLRAAQMCSKPFRTFSVRLGIPEEEEEEELEEEVVGEEQEVVELEATVVREEKLVW